MAMTKAQKAEKQEYIEKLRAILKPGDTLYTVLRHVSSSGMSRDIDVYLLRDNDREWLSYMVAKATGHRFNERKEAITVGGCGMDMGFSIVYDLSRTLYGNVYKCEACGYEGPCFTCPTCVTENKQVGGFECIGEGCPSNDHRNGDRDYTPGHLHSDGGYALKHKWL